MDNILFLDVDQGVFDWVIEGRYKCPVLNYKETCPHLIQSKTIYNDINYMSLEAKKYLLRFCEDYLFFVEKLKRFKRKMKNVTVI